RHLDVEQQQVGRELRGCLDRLEAVGALGDNLDVSVLGQQLAQNPSRELFIIDNRDAQAGPGHVFVCSSGRLTCPTCPTCPTRPSRVTAGIRTSTRKRPSRSSA